MKINELKKPKPQINEGFLDALIGDYGAASLQSMFKSGTTTKAQLAKNIFIKDFVGDAMASLTTGLQSGRVVPSAAPAAGGAVSPAAGGAVAPAAVGAAAPAAGGAAAPAAGGAVAPAAGGAVAPAAGGAAAPAAGGAAAGGKNAAATDSYENLKGQIRRIATLAGAKPLPDNYAAALNSDMAKLAKGDKESGAYAANKILKFANAGYDVSKLAPTWTASSKAGEKFLTQSVYRAITNMLREHGLTWDNLGLRIRLYESASNSGVFLSRCKPIPVATPDFKKMDLVFEGIVTELFGFGKKQPVAANPNAMGVADFIRAWLKKYMGPVDWSASETNVEPLIQAIEANYKKPNKALTDLANAMFAIASISPNVPPGIENALPQQGAPAKTSPFGNYQPTGNEPPAVKTGQQSGVNSAAPAVSDTRDNLDPRMSKIYKDNPELLKRANAGDPEARKQIAALLKAK